MRYRSTNARGWTHHQGDLVSNVDSSHGVLLSGGSSGGLVQPVGDDANISIEVSGKGTGGVRIGNSSSPVLIGGSTAPFAGMLRVTDTAVNTPSFSTKIGQIEETTATFSGVNSSHFVLAFTNNSPATSVGLIGARVSSAAEVILTWVKAGDTAAVAASTVTVSMLAFRF